MDEESGRVDSMEILSGQAENDGKHPFLLISSSGSNRHKEIVTDSKALTVTNRTRHVFNFKGDQGISNPIRRSMADG